MYARIKKDCKFKTGTVVHIEAEHDKCPLCKYGKNSWYVDKDNLNFKSQFWLSIVWLFNKLL